ncbi:thiamine phosphate synthase [Bizionia gelidisalsuginis]|uniref:Thiamine-phosphate synthase n=2 Tax=Bizionia TaxID=283785 RepID=A0A8H2QFE2_9FLAO|nr:MULTISPECIES: thiamine phosphate synthase [Bizionia]TYB78016.1 thiamine phosphate synthase [Bizionia saleffrena]TYC12680.1 thiamine phosphate synthase [Bizionia gelidisalsuginis]
MISKLHYITQGDTPEIHLENIQKACSSGADWIQLRLKDVNEETLLKTALKARELTAHFQTRLIINDHYKIAKEVRADGVHLGTNDACPIEVRDYLGKFYSIGGTANTLEDCENLIKKGVDYIGLGPFKLTSTKTNLSPILEIEGYQNILKTLKTDTPIIAIGGITLQNVADIVNTGVYGIAVSGEITRDFNNINALNEIINGPTLEQRYTFDKKENDEQ